MCIQILFMYYLLRVMNKTNYNKYLRNRLPQPVIIPTSDSVAVVPTTLTAVSSRFSETLETNATIVPQIKRRPFCSLPFPVHYP
jgi:hypothetical protein